MLKVAPLRSVTRRLARTRFGQRALTGLPATDGTVYLTGMAAQDPCVGIRTLDHWMETR